MGVWKKIAKAIAIGVIGFEVNDIVKGSKSNDVIAIREPIREPLKVSAPTNNSEELLYILMALVTFVIILVISRMVRCRRVHNETIVELQQ